jgi:hypothetical protein
MKETIFLSLILNPWYNNRVLKQSATVMKLILLHSFHLLENKSEVLCCCIWLVLRLMSVVLFCLHFYFLWHFKVIKIIFYYATFIIFSCFVILLFIFPFFTFLLLNIKQMNNQNKPLMFRSGLIGLN